MSHVLVMGGTSGIGRAVAQRLVAAGARVSVVGRSMVQEIGLTARCIAVDLREPGAADRAVAQAVEAFGPLDAAVNSAAGVVLEGPNRLHELDDAAFERELVMEMRIVAGSMRAELSHALAAPGRRFSIVNVSSINGLGASPRAPYYSAVKAAQLALTKNAALDYATDGVRVNAVALGVFDTPMLARVHDIMTSGHAEAARAQMTALIPLHRIGDPDEAAAAIAWLCGPESTYVTGATWVIDGGLTAFAR